MIYQCRDRAAKLVTGYLVVDFAKPGDYALVKFCTDLSIYETKIKLSVQQRWKETLFLAQVTGACEIGHLKSLFIRFCAHRSTAN